MKLSLVKLAPLGMSGLALLLGACAGANPEDRTDEPIGTASAAIDATPVSTFGANPGNLLMYSYIPQGMPQNAPVVFSLHGCTQEMSGSGTPAMEQAGWNTLADQYKFYVVYPQQQTANNTEGCFNFFGNTSGGLADITRGQGEAESIHEMVLYMQTTYSVDPSRIFVTGFSAGAAYTVALLALYPDVFAGGASFEGIAFGCATSLSSAYTCMYTATNNTASQWEALAKAGYPGYTGKYPRISIWEGSADTTVAPANQPELVSQWTAVTGASTSPTSMNSGTNYTHAMYANTDGAVEVETYTISGMNHAVAIDPTHGCGTASSATSPLAGNYFVDEGVCAADIVAQFFGLEGNAPQALSDAGAGSGTGNGQTVQGTGNGGSGMNNLGMSGSGTGESGSGAGTGDATEAPDAGAGPVTMPGCSAAPTGATSGAGTGLGVFGMALAALALVRRRRSGVGSRGVGNRAGIFAAIVAVALVGSLFGLPGIARADEGEAPPPDAVTPSGKTPKPAYLGPQGAFFTGASVNTTPALLFGVFPANHFATTVGLGMSYNANGSPTSPLTGIKGAANNRFGADFMLDAMYFVYDKAPFAMGPELNFIGSLSPNYPLSVIVVTPMWALRYAPWKAPIAIGTGLGAGIAFERGAKPVVNLATQGLDIVYAF